MYWNALYMSEKREFKPCSAIEMMPWAFFFFLNSSSLLTFGRAWIGVGAS